MLQIGILGVGHLGRIHLRCIQMIADYCLVGFYDPDDHNATLAVQEFGLQRFTSEDSLIAACEVLDIVTPTTEHYRLAVKCIEQGRHFFVEKPITYSTEQSAHLVALVEGTGLKAAVGHVERYNPAFRAIDHIALRPGFIEAHRLGRFNPRGTDVSVVLDLMIHDIDLALHLVNSPVKRISASGVAIVSQSPDISNARIEFENGSVANLTASRVSMKQMRKMRLFQKGAYLSLDFLKKNAEVLQLVEGSTLPPEGSPVMELDTPFGKKTITHYAPPPVELNAIREELADLAAAIATNRQPAVPLLAGHAALSVANIIMQEIEKQNAIRL